MATDAPLSRLVLRATSVADDLGYVALADLAHVFGKDADYRVIGGHMVTALVARWNLGAELYRETDDTDIGVKQRNVFVNDYAPRTRCDRECRNARRPCLTSRSSPERPVNGSSRASCRAALCCSPLVRRAVLGRRRVEPELCPEQAQLMPFDVVHRDAAPALG